MKILATQTLDLTTNGLMSALTVFEHECRWLNPNKPVYDAFYEFKPDIVLCNTSEFVNKFEAVSKEYNTICVVLNSAISEDKVFGYCPKPAANLAQFIGKYNEDFHSDFSYIHLTNNHDIILSYIEQFIEPQFTDYHLKIYGNPLPYINYIGKINILDIGMILKSSRFLLDLSNELVLDAWMNECISVPYRSNPNLFPEDIFGRYEHPNDLSNHLLQHKNDIFINSKIKAAQKWILDKNTYYHRAIELFEILGLTCTTTHTLQEKLSYIN